MAETRHTREQLKTWTVPQISRYLKDCGVVVGADEGRKDQLVDKVLYASLMGLEVLQDENQLIDNITQKRKEKLTLEGILLPPPESIDKNWLRGSEYLPDTTYCDLEGYFQGNKVMKALAEGKSFFVSGHVPSAEYNGISNDVRFCYVRGEVVPQTRITEKPYTVWVCLQTETGTVVTAECKCLAGLGEVKHGHNKTCTSRIHYRGKKQ